MLAVRWAAIVIVALPACSFDARGITTIARDSGARDTEIEDRAIIEDTFVAGEDTRVEDTRIDDANEGGPIFDSASPLPGCASLFRDGHEYLFCENDANWDQARTTCQIVGYDLAVVSSGAEHDFIVATIKSKSKNDWHIGLTDRAKESEFVWVDGSKASFTRWATLQPDNFWFNEDCVVVRRDGTWNDVDCTGGPREAFVCESL